MNSYITSIKLGLLTLVMLNGTQTLHASQKSGEARPDRAAMRAAWEKRALNLKKDKATTAMPSSAASSSPAAYQVIQGLRNYSAAATAAMPVIFQEENDDTRAFERDQAASKLDNKHSQKSETENTSSSSVGFSTHTVSTTHESNHQELADLKIISSEIYAIGILASRKSSQRKNEIIQELIQILHPNISVTEKAWLLQMIGDKVQDFCKVMQEKCMLNPALIAHCKVDLKRIADGLREETSKLQAAISSQPAHATSAGAIQSRFAAPSGTPFIPMRPSASSQASVHFRKKTEEDREEKHQQETRTTRSLHTASTIPAQRPAQSQSILVEVVSKEELAAVKLKGLLTKIQKAHLTDALPTKVRLQIATMYELFTGMPVTATFSIIEKLLNTIQKAPSAHAQPTKIRLQTVSTHELMQAAKTISIPEMDTTNTISISDMITLIIPTLKSVDIKVLNDIVQETQQIVDELKLKKPVPTQRTSRPPAAKR